MIAYPFYHSHLLFALHIRNAAFCLDRIKGIPPVDFLSRNSPPVPRQLSARQVANSWAEPRNRILVSASDPTSPSHQKTGVRN